jgi:Protein of unknown function (DUF3579).
MADSPAGKPFIIRGITRKGGQFRPSDWSERLAGAFSAMTPDNRMNYSPYVQPTSIDGVRCVVIDKALQGIDPIAYRFLQTFAKSNDLVTENED